MPVTNGWNLMVDLYFGTDADEAFALAQKIADELMNRREELMLVDAQVMDGVMFSGPVRIERDEHGGVTGIS